MIPIGILFSYDIKNKSQYIMFLYLNNSAYIEYRFQDNFLIGTNIEFYDRKLFNDINKSRTYINWHRYDIITENLT